MFSLDICPANFFNSTNMSNTTLPSLERWLHPQEGSRVALAAVPFLVEAQCHLARECTCHLASVNQGPSPGCGEAVPAHTMCCGCWGDSKEAQLMGRRKGWMLSLSAVPTTLGFLLSQAWARSQQDVSRSVSGSK